MMADNKLTEVPEIEQTLIQIHRELTKLRQKCDHLHNQNEKMRAELSSIKGKGKSIFNGMSDKDRLAFKQHVNNLILRIDRYLPD
jgi:regulator of replication initiation timing